MKKLAFAAVLAIAALLVMFTMSSSAQAYPDVQISLTVDQQVVYGGDTITTSAASDVDCSWSIDWNGATRSGGGASFSTTFKAPQVSQITKIPLSGVCSYVDPKSLTKSDADPATWQHQLTITVLPNAAAAAAAPNQGTADLANTGGPDRMYLAGGVVLLLAGATVATVARRRAEDAELPTSTV